ASRLTDHARRHARELRYLQAVAAIGGPVLHGVEKHDAVTVLGRVEVYVGTTLDLGGERGELEVVRGKQRQRVDSRGDITRHRPGERQAVEGAGAAADLIEQDETARGGVVEDVGRLGHLHHEGGAPAGKIVRRSDAGEDPIDGPAHCTLRGKVAAAVRKQYEEDGLAQVGRIIAHLVPVAAVTAQIN